MLLKSPKNNQTARQISNLIDKLEENINKSIKRNNSINSSFSNYNQDKKDININPYY